MLAKLRLMLLISMLCTGLLYAQTLPESPHPYPHCYNHTQVFSLPGATALEVTFDSRTATESEADCIYIWGKMDEQPLRYSGRALSGLTVRVEGDTVKIKLVSDDSKNAYGYKVTRIAPPSKTPRRTSLTDLYQNTQGLYNQALKDELYRLVKNHTSLGYTNARKKMFGEIDNQDGRVRCVYTGRWVNTHGIPNANDMNTEHTWPKSKGAGSEPAKSDLNHLFPTDSVANSRRSNYPFGMVVTITWSKGGSKLGNDNSGERVFTPREDHRGDVARAMFYFAIRYRKHIPASEEQVLRQWHQQDPVDDKERNRNDAIENYQKKRNPFIDRPDFVNRIDDF